MAGNKKGGLKTKKTILQRYGKDYYHRIGKKGGNPVLIAQRDAKKSKASLVELA